MAQTPDRDQTPAATSRVGADLMPRVVSGVVLAAIALGATLAGSHVFAVLIALVCAIVAWEWGRIVRGVDLDVVMAAHVVSVLAAVGLAAFGLAALGAMAVLIGAILVGLLSFGRSAILSSVGVLFAGLPGVALVWLRGDEPYGVWAVLYLMAMVVVTDTAAYFAGRLIGGPKLWPAVSPKKTWAGLLGAIAGTLAAGAGFSALVGGASPMRLALVGGVTALIAQAGDLAESALKRRFQTKDASNLIPGHGGFMDRIDGLVTAAIAAALLAALVDVTSPARALLLG